VYPKHKRCGLSDLLIEPDKRLFLTLQVCARLKIASVFLLHTLHSRHRREFAEIERRFLLLVALWGNLALAFDANVNVEGLNVSNSGRTGWQFKELD